MKTLQPQLRLGEVVPYLSLPSNRNGEVALWDFKQTKNLVIVFHHRTYCVHCVAMLKELSEAYPKFQELGAELLAISSDSITKLRAFAKEVRIPLHLLSDENGEAAVSFTCWNSEESVAFLPVFIADRFGVLRYQQIVSEAHELIDVKEMLNWLFLIQTECPECSHL